MAHEHPIYVALLRAVFRASDDVEAIMIADQIKVNGEKDLEPEDGDTLDVTQVTQNAAQLTPEETVMLLRRARNALIRMRVVPLLDCARELDKCVHIIVENQKDPGLELVKYDYGRFIDIQQEIFAGGNPVHY